MTLKDIDAINAEYVRLRTEGGHDDYNPPKAKDILQYLIDAIDSAPTIEAKPVQKSEWEETGWANAAGKEYKCLNCKVLTYTNAIECQNFCHHCGAEMQGLRRE